MKLIGVLGRKRSGKDTISDYMCKTYNFQKMSLAQPLKDCCKILFNFSDEQLYGDMKETIDPMWHTSPRKALQYLGTSVFRNDINKLLPGINDNFWINSVIAKYLKLCQSADNSDNVKVIISDVRFQNEIDEIHKKNGIIIKISRPSLENIDDHESEKNIDIMDGDYNIINDGSLEELYTKVDSIVKIVFTK